MGAVVLAVPAYLRRLLGRPPPPLLTLPQRLLGLPQVGNVGACAEPLDDVAAGVPDGHPARLEPAVFPVAAADTVFHVVRMAPRHGLQPEVSRPLAVL